MPGPAHTHRAASARPAPLRRFADRYGWRAYALPVLSALTVAVAVDPGAARHPRTAQAAATQRSAAAAAGTPASRPAASRHGPTFPAQIVQLATDSTACLTNSAPQLVLVSISAQHAWMCEHARQVNTTPVTTGTDRAGQATPTGSWVVQAKQTNRELTGAGYADFVHYWVPFNRDVGFHDAPWQTMPFGAPGYHTHGSHGCVHLPLPAMAWLYGWIRIGTLVTVEA